MIYQLSRVIWCQNHPNRKILCYQTQNLEDEGVHTFPKGISPKVNVIAQMEFDITRYDIAGQYVSHYATVILRVYYTSISTFLAQLFLKRCFCTRSCRITNNLNLIYLTHRWDPNRYYRSWSERIWLMVMNEYPTFPKARGLEPHHLTKFSVMPRYPVDEILPHCWGAVGLFFSSNRRGISAPLSRNLNYTFCTHCYWIQIILNMSVWLTDGVIYEW